MEQENIKTIETTLLILMKNDLVMLAKKKSGLGAGLYSGVGGKIQEGEAPEKALIRQTIQEVDVSPINCEKVGLVDFIEYIDGERVRLLFHLYVGNEWVGELKETEYMEPRWFSVNNVPYDKMWADDKHWLPHVLAGNKFDAHFEFDVNGNLVNHKIIFSEEHSFGPKK